MVVNVVDELPKFKDVMHGEQSILENSVLFHGLKGDNTRRIKKDEIQVLREILESGSLQSPSLRKLSDEERKIYLTYRSDDFNRIVFDAVNDNSKEYTRHYIGSVLLILPVSSLRGYVIAEDPFDVRYIDTIGAHSPNGVTIPIDKALLVIGSDQYEQVKNEIEAYCKTHNLDMGKFLAIVPEILFDRPWELLDLAKKRIGLSKGITYIPTTKEEQVTYMKKNNTKDADSLLMTKPIATGESLGIA